jgi:hypothetical protein
VAGFQGLWLAPASRANQDNAGNTFTLDTSDVPAREDGFLYVGQTVIAKPTAPFAGRADGEQGVHNVQRLPLACFNCAQHRLHAPSLAICDLALREIAQHFPRSKTQIVSPEGQWVIGLTAHHQGDADVGPGQKPHRA